MITRTAYCQNRHFQWRFHSDSSVSSVGGASVALKLLHKIWHKQVLRNFRTTPVLQKIFELEWWEMQRWRLKYFSLGFWMVVTISRKKKKKLLRHAAVNQRPPDRFSQNISVEMMENFQPEERKPTSAEAVTACWRRFSFNGYEAAKIHIRHLLGLTPLKVWKHGSFIVLSLSVDVVTATLF